MMTCKKVRKVAKMMMMRRMMMMMMMMIVKKKGDEEEEECLAARRARLADRGIDEQKLFEVRLPKKRAMKRCWLGIVVANLDFRGICGGRRGEGGPGGGLSARGLASR